MIIYMKNEVVKTCSLMSSVPEGVTGYEVEAPADKEFRDAWVINAGQLDYNLDKAKESKIKEANTLCEESLKVITEGYSEAEMKTWDIQEAEARAYVANNSASVPFLTNLSSISGVSVLDLANKIIAKADAFKIISATEIAKRQVMEKSAIAATTIDELKAI